MEPKYCICQQPSQGQMIGCDSDSCRYEWFHYACVGVSEEPEDWLCPECRIKAGGRGDSASAGAAQTATASA